MVVSGESSNPAHPVRWNLGCGRGESLPGRAAGSALSRSTPCRGRCGSRPRRPSTQKEAAFRERQQTAAPICDTCVPQTTHTRVRNELEEKKMHFLKLFYTRAGACGHKVFEHSSPQSLVWLGRQVEVKPAKAAVQRPNNDIVTLRVHRNTRDPLRSRRQLLD